MVAPLTILITYSSADRAFIRALLDQCMQLSDDIVVAVGSHRFQTMEPEDMNHIYKIAGDYSAVKFVLYDVTEVAPSDNPLKHRPGAYWNNVARMCAIQSRKRPNDSWVLFIDADEIPDAALFSAWWNMDVSKHLYKDVAYFFANYWYFREPTYRATTIECSPVMVHSSRIANLKVMIDGERQGMVAHMPTITVTKEVMFHHYSWVRTRDSMIKKVQSSAHLQDRDNWIELIEEEFSRPFNGTDFVHGYRYVMVPNQFDIEVK